MILNLFIVFIINALSNCIGTLKTIFISQKVKKPTYCLVYLDGFIFISAMKLVFTGDGFIYTAAYCFGKVFGAWLADFIEEKIALGLIETKIYMNKEIGINVADRLRNKGFSVTTQVGYGLNGKDRLIIEVTLLRKEFKELKSLLNGYGYANPTMSVNDVKSVTGKISIHSLTRKKRYKTKVAFD